MSQAGVLTVSTSGGAIVETLTGNSGGAVGPSAAFNIDVLGSNSTGINIIGTPASNLLSVEAIQATTGQRGTVTLATNAETITGTDTSKVTTPDDIKAKLGVQTLHGLPIGAGTSTALAWTAAPTNGQLLIGSNGVDPVLANLTSTGGTITITNGAGSINLDLAGGGIAFDQISVDANTPPGTNPVLPSATGQLTITGAQVATGTVGANVIRTDSLAANSLTIEIQRSTAVAATDSTENGVSHFDSSSFAVDANGFVTASATGLLKTLTGDSGGALSPTLGNINTLGTGSITIAGAGSTLTTQLTGLTNHALQVGAGTATLTQLGPTATAGQVLQSAGAAADPAFSTATYPATTTINQILYSSAANTVTGLATANRGVLTTGATGVPVVTALATDGQLIIGSTAGVPAAATLTAGTGISITNASNSITITASGAGFTWTAIGASQTLVVGNGYFCTSGGALSLALPAVSAVGDTIQVFLDGSTSWTITQPNAGSQIRIGNTETTLGVGGSLASTVVGDTVELVCQTANARWAVVDVIGNITVV